MWRRLSTILVATLVCMALALVYGSGCRGCSGGDIAEMTKHRGDVKRDTPTTQQRWETASDGVKLSMGDGLKTGPDADAIVRLKSGGKIALASDTTLRFLTNAKAHGGAAVAVETGEASLEADDKALAIETSIGVAHIEAGGKLRLSAGDGGSTRFEVTVGAARVDTEDGGVSLSPGRAIDVSVGGAIVERETAAKADASAADAPPRRADVPETTDAGPPGVTVEVKGAGVRMQARGATAWQPLAEGGGVVSSGATLEIPAGVVVEVKRGAKRGRLVGHGRFVVGDEGGALVRASGGHVEIEATSEDVAVDVPGGVIVAKATGADGKSRVDADVKAAETKVSIRQGQSEVRGGGTPESLRAGESAVLSAKGTVVVSGRGPERADLTVRAGDSLIVRDPKPPTALGFDYSAVCSGAAVVSRGDGSSARGERGRVAMFLPAGHHEYTVRCIGPDGVEDNAAATGTATIIADAALADLARLPPATVVDTDGRRYTVLYQNQLPSVIARWPGAPAGSSYVLHVDKDKTKGAAPKQSLRSGTISEGTHTLWFETEDGRTKSPETTLVIKFDNAAPAASVREPANGSFQPGDTVKVAGVVVEGWTVHVSGQPVALDEQKRFSTTTTVPPGDSAIVLRLSHPKRGIVYYVRHAKAPQ
jgi:hypothetical protein